MRGIPRGALNVREKNLERLAKGGAVVEPGQIGGRGMLRSSLEGLRKKKGAQRERERERLCFGAEAYIERAFY